MKRFYRYDHRTASLREFFIRTVLRRSLNVRHAEFMLRGLNLEVRRGEAVAIIGSNGSGKSTALRVIAGIYEPTEGSVTVTGRMAAVIELGAGFHPELTGAENVTLYGGVMGLSRREINAIFPTIVEFAEIGDFISEPVKYYSSGMQARLAFAMAVCSSPEILLLDEVLAVGDHAFRVRCLEHLRTFRDRRGTMIVVSHELDVIREFCSRALWLDRGETLMDGPVDDVLAAYAAHAPAQSPAVSAP